MSNNGKRWSIDQALLDPSNGQRNSLATLPGFGGLPFRGVIPDRKEDDPEHMQPKQGCRVHIEILEMNDEKDRKRTRYLIVPRVVRLRELAGLEKLSRYRLLILANVPALPKKFADRLPEYLQAGGGLLLVPGDRCLPRFYNEWIDKNGKPLSPAKLVKRVSAPDKPVRLALTPHSHHILLPCFPLFARISLPRTCTTAH